MDPLCDFLFLCNFVFNLLGFSVKWDLLVSSINRTLNILQGRFWIKFEIKLCAMCKSSLLALGLEPFDSYQRNTFFVANLPRLIKRFLFVASYPFLSFLVLVFLHLFSSIFLCIDSKFVIQFWR